MDAFPSVKDAAADSGVHHLGHLAASCAIILDAIAAGQFNDDRPEDVGLETCMGAAADVIASWPEAMHQVHGK